MFQFGKWVMQTTPSFVIRILVVTSIGYSKDLLARPMSPILYLHIFLNKIKQIIRCVIFLLSTSKLEKKNLNVCKWKKKGMGIPLLALWAWYFTHNQKKMKKMKMKKIMQRFKSSNPPTKIKSSSRFKQNIT
jgi:uncharacterized membrane protein